MIDVYKGAGTDLEKFLGGSRLQLANRKFGTPWMEFNRVLRLFRAQLNYSQL